MFEAFSVLFVFGMMFLGMLLLMSIRQVNQYQRGVVFFLGKYSRIAQPGWRIILPIIQSMTKVDIRTKAVDVPDQEAITRDNISCRINAVIYYRITEASKSVLEVENFYYATSQIAQTTMRNMVGEVTLDELLRGRDEIAAKIQATVDKATDPWGIKVESVELKDIGLPQDLKRTMAKEAEAEREKRAVIIKAEGEVQAADNMSKAAHTLAESPGALHLRTLQAINDLSSDQSNTTIWMVPVEGLKALDAMSQVVKK